MDPQPRRIAAIPLLVRQHAQDAAFLRVQRSREIDGPSFGEEDLGRRDQRLGADIEGLAAAGLTGWEIAREEAQAQAGPGEWFVLAALALETGAPGALAEALDLALGAGPAGERGLSGAVAWTPPARLGEAVRRWVVSAEPGLRRLGVVALRHHRAEAGPRLGQLLGDPDPGVRGEAARLAGELGRIDAAPRLRELAETGEGEPWPAWSLARLGDAGGPAALLGFVRDRPGDPRAGRALDLALIAAGDRARAEVTALLCRPETHLLALSRIGVLGDPGVLPWLLERMRVPETVAAAGAAFRDFYAIDVNDTDLFTERPEELGPDFAQLDPGPLPVADRIAVWVARPAASLPPFISQRARMIGALRQGLAAPGEPLPDWRGRRRFPAWV